MEYPKGERKSVKFSFDDEKSASHAGKMRIKSRSSDRHDVYSYPGYSLVGKPRR